MEISPTNKNLLEEAKQRIQTRLAEKELHEDFFLPVIPDWALLEAIQVGMSERTLSRMDPADRKAVRSFEENLRHRAQAVGTARSSLIQRVRELVDSAQTLYQQGLILDSVQRVGIALAEYDRVHDQFKVKP